MRQKFISIVFLSISLSILPSFSSAAALPFFKTILKGQALVVDMDENDAVDKNSVLNGKDLVLVKILPVLPKKSGEALSFNIAAISQPDEIIKMDLNHDGIIEKAEMAQANMAFLRYNPSGDITIEPLAESSINQLSYTKNSDGSITIYMHIHKEDEKFKAAFLEL